MRSNMLNKFLSFSYGSWVGLIIGFLGTIVTTRILDPVDFGKASMFTLVLNIVTIVIMFGLDQSFIRFYYEEDKEKRGDLLYNCIRIPLILSVITLISIFVFRNVLSIWLFDETSLSIIVFLMVGIIVQIFYRYTIIVIRMQQKGRLYSNMLILYRITEFSTIIFLYYIFGATYKIIVFSTVASLCIISILGIYKEKEMWKIDKTKSKKLKHSQSELIKFGAPLVVTILITWLFQSFDKIAIRHWSSFNELGLYSAAFKIIALVNVLQTSFATFWTPISYEKFESEPEDKSFYQNMFRLVSFVMFFIAIMSIAGKDIIVFLLGKEYREAAQIMPFLVFMPVMYTVSEITVVGINFFKKPKWHILIATVVCLINITGNIVLVPYYGALGASISTAISYIIFFALRTHISQRYYSIEYEMKRTYFIILLIFIYALLSVVTKNIFLNFLIGTVALLILVMFYIKDIISVYNIFVRSRKVRMKENIH